MHGPTLPNRLLMLPPDWDLIPFTHSKAGSLAIGLDS